MRQFRKECAQDKATQPLEVAVLRRLKMSANIQETHLSLQAWNSVYCIAAVLMVDIVSFGA